MSNVKENDVSTASQESTKITIPIGLGPTGKRLDYITWHQHHMFMAKMLGEMSTEKRPDGCYIVDQEHYQIASGYSGEIILTDDSCHCAVISALHKLERKTNSCEGCVMYITSFPDCDQCLGRILKMKVSKIWYWNSLDGYIESDSQLSKLLESNGILCEKYAPSRTISIDFYE